ncbi:MAG: hypothetical protein KDK70_20585 [Myxococcales bacterium]|nr:hypothetical protein [Myxococcales bacterium]
MMLGGLRNSPSPLLVLVLVGVGCTPPPTEVSPESFGSLTSATTDSDGTTGTGPDTLDGTADTGDTDDGGTGGTGPVFDPVCGDGIIEGDEECDLGGENGQGGYCTTMCLANVCGDGYLGPGEACDDGNQNEGDQCTTQCGLATCGDGAVQAGEECDLGRNNSQTGACLPSCISASCGDLFIHEGVEACDGINTGAQSCMTQGYDAGVLTCSDDCSTLVTSNCHTCGNGLVEASEICDGTAYEGNVDCSDYTPANTTPSGGSLQCTNNCTMINIGNCTYCGDGMVEGSEVCEAGQFGGADCATYATGGNTVSGGALACVGNCMMIDSSDCTYCGDGMVDTGEECDSGVGGATCMDQGFPDGTLACASNCTFDTSDCHDCGNMAIEGPEECDGSEFGPATCASVEGLGHTGVLMCDSACTIDSSDCCLSASQPCGDDNECCSTSCNMGLGTCM